LDTITQRMELPTDPGAATEVQERQPLTATPAPGMVLRGRFVLERMLGAGGMSKVFLAVDRELEDANPYVAIKVLGDTFKDHPQALTSLRREVNNSRQLNHPNIVGVYHFDRDGDIVFMVMEYMRGEPLDEFLKKRRGSLPWEEAWPIIRGCGEALAYMHEHSVIHSDFKPGNIFLTTSNEVKVLDLGIARTIDETLATLNTNRFQAQALLALTPQYASCEMFEGRSPDQRDDIYALGCVAYQLLAGHHPFDGATAPEARDSNLKPKRLPALRNEQWQVLLQTLAHERRQRTPNARDFLTTFGPRDKRQNATPWIAAVGLLVLVGAGAIGLQSYRDSPDQRYVEQLVAQYRDSGNSQLSNEQIRMWLEQGSSNTALAVAAFAADEFERGDYFLHDGTSSARWVYDLVLKQAPSAASKRQAAEGLLQVAAAHELPMLRLMDDGRQREALAHACRGAAINPGNKVLREGLDTLSRAVSNPTSIAACKALPEGILR